MRRIRVDGLASSGFWSWDAGLTYEDIFNAAAEALRLAEPQVGAVTRPVARNEKPAAVAVTPVATTATRPTYHERLAEIKKTARRAYEPWTQEEEARLKDLCLRGLSPHQIARQLQRQPSAIRSRLVKLGLLGDRAAIPDGE